MATRNKKLVALALVGAMTIGMIPAQVQAASSVSGTLSGIAVSGSVSYTSTSATATTMFYGGSAKRSVTVTAYYLVGSNAKKETKTNSASYSTGVTATVTVDSTATVVGGKGSHKVKYGDTTWSTTTTSGATW